MQHVRLLAHSLWESRWSQLAARLRLMIKRKAMVRLRSLGARPGRWYREPAPTARGIVDPAGSVRGDVAANSQLPLRVNLVGTAWEVDVGMEWNPHELDRGTRLEKLHLHYMEYLTKLASEHALRLMMDWVARVPPYLPGYAKDTWNCYALSIRVVTWMDLLTGHGRGAGIACPRIIDQSIAAQLRFLADNLESDIGGNHLMKNIRALLRGGRYFEGTEADAWLRRGLRELSAQLREQVLPDGLHFELSPSYHLQVLEDLMDMRRVLVSVGTETGSDAGTAAQLLHELDSGLRRMALTARRLTHPDELPSLFADGGLHMASPARSLLATLALWGVIEHGEVGRALGSWRLPDGGYAGFGSERGLIVVDCGPVGARHLPSHGHGDALSIEWSVAGRRCIVDAGVFEYHAGPHRAFSRSTAAHNTITLDDLDQSEFWSSFRVARRANVCVEDWQPRADGFRLTASHDGYRRLGGCPIHRRTIDATADRIVVGDSVQGGAGQMICARLLLAPDTRVGVPARDTGGQWRVRLTLPSNAAGEYIRAEVVSSAPIRTATVDASPDFGELVPSIQIVMDGVHAPGHIDWSITVK